jgi:nicotinate-nucleotide adenylyltransferase
MKIGIFGGTFNPVHIAHLYVAEECREALGLDEVVFVPAAMPPHKEVEQGVSPEHRLRMVQLACEGNPHFKVSDVELTLPRPSYSIRTVEMMQERYGEKAKLFFIAGMDSFLEIGSWHAVDRLVTLCDFAVSFRPGTDQRKLANVHQVHEVDIVTLEALDQKLKSLGRMEMTSGRDLWLVSTVRMDVSSTDIRKRLHERRSVKYLLPEKVESYIIQNRLYL